jgi:sulfate adenylyltransferase subunit 1
MVTAASTANLAIILVDARKGVLTQTRRHSYLAHLLGIPHLVVAINKMDLVDYDQATYRRICDDYLEFAATLDIGDVSFIPLSALNGDMIVDRGERLDWYQGPTLLDILEGAPSAHSERDERFRFPVQFVCRPQMAGDPKLHDYRGFMGRVESGEISVGDEVVVLPSEKRTRVKAIEIYGRSLPRAIAEQSVTLLLEDEVDVSRGDMIVKAGESSQVARRIETMLCWLGESPLDPQRKYLIRQTTRETKAAVEAIDYRLDINTLQRMPAERLGMNDIARVFFKLAQPLCVDTYADNRSTGAFIVIDETTNNTVGAGMIL